MSKASSSSMATRISSFFLIIIFIVLAVSVAALVLAVQAFAYNETAAAYLFLLGLIGVASSAYVLLQTRRRMMRLKIEPPPVTTTIECRKCGFKSVREYQRGDFIFKEVEQCQKCNEKMLITAIYREVREKGKETQPF
ncbi:MAG: hypothetical protein QXN87_05145 [Candidatus Bathyarchaeia archaeon]